jgi:hypothetical protein
MSTQTQRSPDQLAASIREANERIVEFGRKAGTEFLEAYERTLLTYADLTRDIAGAFADAGRASLRSDTP